MASRAYYQKNKEEIKRRVAAYKRANPDRVKEAMHNWYLKNKDKVKKRSVIWQKKNPDKVRFMRNRYKKERYANDPLYRLETLTRNRIKEAIKGVYKNPHKTLIMLGVDSLEALKTHLEVQFLPGMTWENYGKKWNIDHIVPISFYDLSDTDQVFSAFNYLNLRPAWATDNFKKGSKSSITGAQMSRKRNLSRTF